MRLKQDVNVDVPKVILWVRNGFGLRPQMKGPMTTIRKDSHGPQAFSNGDFQANIYLYREKSVRNYLQKLGDVRRQSINKPNF
jgi:hypothetical protein